MAEYPSMPLRTGAYLADTVHLTAAEQGAYLLLLMAMWRAGGVLPKNEKILARIARLTPSQWQKTKPSIWPFFQEFPDHIRQGAFAHVRADDESKRPSIPLSIQAAVRRRDGDTCRYCGASGRPVHLDHVLPWSRGGEHSVSNLVVACAPCNLAKGDRTPDEMGWPL